QEVLSGRQFDDPITKQRTGSKIKNMLRLRQQDSALFRTPLISLQLTEVKPEECRYRVHCGNCLDRFPVNYRKTGTQGLMTSPDLFEAALYQSEVKWSIHSLAPGNVVDRTIGFQLIQKPQALLRIGEWWLNGWIPSRNGCCGGDPL